MTALIRLSSFTSAETQEIWVEHWKLAAIIPIPSMLALWAGWREGKRFNTKALLRSVLVLLLVSSLMGLGLLEATVISIIALSVTLVWLPLLLIRQIFAPMKLEDTKPATLEKVVDEEGMDNNTDEGIDNNTDDSPSEPVKGDNAV